MIHTVKGLGIVNKAEVDVSLEFSCLFYVPTDVGNLIPGPSAFSKSSLNIWKFLVYILLKPGLENFGALLCQCLRWVQLCSSLNILWHCLSLGLERKWPFPVLWPLLSFPDLLAYWVQHFNVLFDPQHMLFDSIQLMLVRGTHTFCPGHREPLYVERTTPCLLTRRKSQREVQL